MFCTECGESEQDGNYCRKCGFKLRKETQKSPTILSVQQNQMTTETSVSALHKPYSLERQAIKARMGFGEAIATCFRKYVVFKGRATRAEYWYWQLFWLIVFVGCVFLSAITDSSSGGTLFGLFILGAYLPSLAVLVRRLHDTGKSGWWVLLNGIPIIGWLIVFVFTLQYSEEFDNEYGANAY